MAKRQAPRNAQAPLKRERESDDSIRNRGLTPFLRPEHVAEGEWLKLTGFNSVRERDTDREQIVCEVENESGHTFSLGVRNGSPDHRVLHRTFGGDHRRWIGGVKVTIAEGTKQRGTRFVNVAEADKTGPIWDGPGHVGDEHEPGEDE